MSRSAKTEYACLAMAELARRHGSRCPVRVREIAEQHAIPPQFLVQILLELKRAGFVCSTRGAAGGYRLARPPEEVTLGDVVETMEGTSVPDEQPARSGLAGALGEAFADASEAERDRLDAITLSDLVEQAMAGRGSMYYI